MDIHTMDDGKVAVIKTSKSFILIINDEIYGSFLNTKESVMKIYNILKDIE